MPKLVLHAVLTGGLLVLGPQAAWGNDSLDLATILSRHYEAMGGLEHLESIKGLRIGGEYDWWTKPERLVLNRGYKLAPKITYEWAEPYQLRFSTSSNGSEVTYCLNDMHAWALYPYVDSEMRVKVNAVVQHFDHAITSEWRAFSEWWGPLVGARKEGSRVELLGKKVVLGSPRFALRLSRLGGPPQVVYLSQESYLPVRIDSISNVDGKTIEIHTLPRMYRKMGGVLLPTQIVERTPGGEKLSTWHLKEAEVTSKTRGCVLAPHRSSLHSGSVKSLRGKLKGNKIWRQVAPVNTTARVAILPPKRSENLEWVYANWSINELTGNRNVYLVKAELAELFETEIQKIICGLFPRCEVVESLGPGDTFDLSFQGDFRVSATTRSSPFETSLRRVNLRAGVFVGLGDAGPVEVISLSQSTTPQGFVERSHLGGTRGLGSRGLSYLLRDLATDLPRSVLLADVLEGLERRHAQAPDLRLEVAFLEPEDAIANGRLDAGERAQVRLVLHNRGPGPAFGTRVQLLSPGAALDLPSVFTVPRLEAEEKWEKTVSLSAPLDLPAADIEIQVSATEDRGYVAESVVLRVAGAQLVRPTFEVVDVALNDSTRPSEGNGDGRPSNGETIEVVARVANRGPGVAVGALVTCQSHTGGVEVMTGRVELSSIAAHATQNAKFLVRLPQGFSADRLDLTITASEVRGKEVAHVEKIASWPTVLRFAKLVPEVLLRDGDSPGSVGDRDGVANNGEKIELVVRLSNNGDISALGTRLTLRAETPGLQVLEPVMELGELPADRGSLATRFQVLLPRAASQLERKDLLAFRLEIHQQNRSMEEHRLTVPFYYRRPQLVLETATPEQITPGVAESIQIQLRNLGSFRAEDVVLELLMAEGGEQILLQGSRSGFRHAIGILEPGSSSLPVTVGILVPVGFHADRTLEIDVVVQQRDFPESRQLVPLSVGVVGERIVRVEPREAPPGARGLPPAGSRATISFLSPFDGTETSATESLLRFEVHVPSALEDLRLTRNGRRVVLGGPVRLDTVRGGSTDSIVQLYEVPVSLEEGENLIQVVALTREGHRSVRDLLVLRRPRKGKLWVAAIGVSDYQRPEVNDLNYAAKDARAVARYYRTEMGLPQEQVLTLTDQQATLQNVKRLLGTRMSSLAHDPDDTVILYFAGHGLSEADEASRDSDHFSKYLLPYDGVVDDLFATAFPMEDIWKIVQRIRAKRVVFIIDACFSGAAGGRTVYDPDRIPRARLSDEFLRRIAGEGEGRVILTASGANEVAREEESFGHGTFTYFFLRGLRGEADGNGDGDISVDEIYAYTSQQVRRKSGNSQNPEKKAPRQAGEILIGRVVSARP